MRRPILNHTHRGDLVYDPFLGSGTSVAACEQTGRVCCGLEMDPRYVDVVIMRWQKLTGKQATLEGDGRTFGQITAECRPAEAEVLPPDQGKPTKNLR
jgi:DNA modification methylase